MNLRSISKKDLNWNIFKKMGLFKNGRVKIYKYLVFALCFALLNAGVVFFVFGFQKFDDTRGYLQTIDWFQGESKEVSPYRVLRPLGPLLALPFEFLGKGAGLIVQNIIFYLLSSFLIFKITELIYRNKKQSFFASLFFVTAIPMITRGLTYLTDMGAWFFYLLSIFLTLLYFRNKKEKLIILNGFLSGLGILMKENGGLGILFFGLMILFSKEFDFKEKISKIVTFSIFFIIPLFFIQFFTYQYFQYTSLDWYLFNVKKYWQGQPPILTVLRYLTVFFRILGLVWIFFFIGLWKELRKRNWQRLKIYLALLPSSLSFFAWPAIVGRIAFVFAPLGILLATYGCKRIKTLLIMPIVLLILIFNYTFILEIDEKIHFTEIIYTSLFSK